MNHIDNNTIKPVCPTSSAPARTAQALLRVTAPFALLLAFLTNGCVTPEIKWPEEVKEKRTEEKQLATQKLQLVREHSDIGTARNYFQTKAAVVEKEKNANEESLFTTRGNIRSIFQNLKTAMDNIGDLYDCYLGEEVIIRQNVSADIGSTLLVDLGNPAFCDMTLVAGAIYSESPATVTFCTIGAVADKPGYYEVLSVGEEFIIDEKGKHTLKFGRRFALRIKANEYIGLFVTSGTQIHYDLCGTGKTFAVPMNALARNNQFQLDPDTPPTVGDKTAVDDNGKPLDYNRAYSFRLWGFKR